MFIFFLVVAVLLFVFFVSISLWLTAGKGSVTKPDGTPYSATVLESTAKSTKAVGRALTAATGLALLACAGWYFLYFQSAAQITQRKTITAERECNDTTMAFVMSQGFVKRDLKAPASAKFPMINNVKSLAVGECRFLVSAYVDAQNSFGAMMRTNYTAEIEYVLGTDKWRIINLSME